MGNVIDLTAQPDHEILHRTEKDGLLGGRYLHGEPLASHLEPDETAKYVLRNKGSGLTVEGERERRLEPGEEYQMFAMVTDVRIEFVAGQEGGDETLTLPLADVVEADVESGLRTSTLTVETLANERWVFPCRGDPSPVAAYLEDGAQIWANAERLLDDLEEALGTARDHLSGGEYGQARTVLDEGETTLETAHDRIAELGGAASARIGERGSDLRRRLVDIRRELYAQRGARAHARAQECWRDGEYETAAEAYERTVESYEAALDVDGSAPTDEALQSRHRAAVAERELLRVGPLVDADTSRRRAGTLTDPEDAAAEWEVALDRYRELLGLEWGSTDQEFVADHELLREQTAEIADDAIDDHREAGRRWLRSGDKLAVQGRSEQASQVYDRARHQFEQARRLADEVKPARTAEIERALEATARRLDGETPASEVPEDPIDFDPTDETGAAEFSASDEMEGLTFHDSGGTAPAVPTEEGPAKTGTTPGGSSPSVLERIQAQKQSSFGSETGGDDPESATGTSKREIGDRETIDELSPDEFTGLVAELWEQEGWTTTVFEDAGEPVYDVVAMRQDPERRLLIWTRHGGEEATRTVVKQSTTTLESRPGFDGAVVVTTDAPARSTRERADELGVEVVGPETLVERLREANLGDWESPQA